MKSFFRHLFALLLALLNPLPVIEREIAATLERAPKS